MWQSVDGYCNDCNGTDRETATMKLFKDLKEEIKLYIKNGAILRKRRFYQLIIRY